MNRILSILTCAGGCLMLIVPSASAREVPLPPVTQDTVVPGVARGDVLIDDVNGVTIAVPGPGQGLAVSTNGETITIENSFPGAPGVRVSRSTQSDFERGPDHVEQPSSKSRRRGFGRAVHSSGECSANAYIRLAGANGPAWPSTFVFRASSANKPASVQMAAFSAAVGGAVLNWTQVQDDCGFPDTVGLVSSQAADTTSPTSIVVNGSGYWGCPSVNDDFNTEYGWAYAANATGLALACTYYTTYDSPTDGDNYYDVGASDATLNTRFIWANNISICDQQYYLTENTLTHEVGHSLGLGDLYGSTHEPLTMYGYTHPCFRGDESLGYGDYLGISALY